MLPKVSGELVTLYVAFLTVAWYEDVLGHEKVAPIVPYSKSVLELFNTPPGGKVVKLE